MVENVDDTKWAEFERRLRALEERELHRPDSADSASEQIDADPLWALQELQRRLALTEETRSGAVLFTGSLELPGGEKVAWQEGAGSRGLLEQDWADLADRLAALGHPVRLEILKNILVGTRSTAELSEIATLGTTGQLHHHLRELRSSGWVRSVGRGRYEVPAARVVRLLVTLLAGGQR